MRNVTLGLAWVSVNLEFIFLLLFLLQRYPAWLVAWGHWLTTVGLVLVAWAVGQGLQLLVPEWVVGGAGLVPLVWALHAPHPPTVPTAASADVAGVVATLLVLTARCQLALFLPVMAGASGWALLAAVGLLSVLTPLLILAVRGLATKPAWAEAIATRAQASTKACVVLAGAFVALDAGLVDQLVKVVSA